MTRKQAIADLIEKVEAGTLIPSNLIVDAATSKIADDIAGEAWADLFGAYDGSLDAAKALHEAVIGPMPARMHSDARKQLLDTLTLLHAQQGDPQ